jgi:glyoxylase-like metal-dependent hydrolase (beta-lactamase superfamily II)/rhodanese-related sulfurtransferase
MIFHQIATGGCQSYLLGCPDKCVAVLIDPAVAQIDRYVGLLAKEGLRLRYVIDTHTHADHFSAADELKGMFGVPAVMHRNSPAPHADMRLDNGDMLIVGGIRMSALHTPGHTSDSMCLHAADRVFTGDTLLIGGTGRTDLPTGDPEELHDSLFNRLLKLEPETTVYPAHDYKGRQSSSIGQEIANNPRLQKRDRAEFVAMMQELNLSAPDHMTEALRTNLSGGKTVDQLLAEASARVPFMNMEELRSHIDARQSSLIVLDVRERQDFDEAHIPGATHLPRGQLELRVNQLLPDPTRKIVTVCELGKISTLAAATLRDLGFRGATALDGGMQAWRSAAFPTEQSA